MLSLTRIHGLLMLVALACVTACAPAWATPPASAKQCPSGVHDGCYARGEMRQFTGVAIELVNEYFGQLSPGRPVRPRAVVYVADGSARISQCSDGSGRSRADSNAYEYCPVDDSVYLGQSALWEFYSNFGAISPVAGLAHEYGHMLQSRARIPQPSSASDAIAQENQADCVAGAFTRFLRDSGHLERGDLRNVGRLLQAIGSDEGPGRDHGTPAEREQAFAVGYRGALRACDRYTPGRSLAAALK